jgi:tRNA U34 5-methylaminomethyl-2-thiouridine-forming methyltransferase MnmC
MRKRVNRRTLTRQATSLLTIEVRPASERIRCVATFLQAQTPPVSAPESYKLVQLRNGAHSVHSTEHGETMHPGLGPAAEAEELYVRQLRLLERQREWDGEFVIWDVGLGAAANALTILRASREVSNHLHLISFEHTLEPLRFALQARSALGYFAGYEHEVEKLIAERRVEFRNGTQSVRWELHVGDFPVLMRSDSAPLFAKPHAVVFDPWSPAKNPAMWTAPLLANVFRLLAPSRPCAMPTYSRSTMLRVSLLLAGFFVGSGPATGRKEETTIAANARDLVPSLLGRDWLERARRSGSAEPMWEPVYRQAPLQPTTLERLLRHPQFV